MDCHVHSFVVTNPEQGEITWMNIEKQKDFHQIWNSDVLSYRFWHHWNIIFLLKKDIYNYLILTSCIYIWNIKNIYQDFMIPL